MRRVHLPDNGGVASVRVRNGFLIFPKNIHGDWRWLCWAVWVERYYEHIRPRRNILCWKPDRWIYE